MPYMLMAVGEDGTEFRATDAEYKTQEAAMRDIDEARESWPCATFKIEWFNDRDLYQQQYKDWYEDDVLDMY